MKRFTLSLTLLLLVGCGGSDSPTGFVSTFGKTDTVTQSVFPTPTPFPIEGQFFLTIVSRGVSSGFVELNDLELLGPSDFHNKSFERTLAVSLFDNNTVSVELRGSPGDQLCVRAFEVLEDLTQRGIFERCVDRQAGPPNHVEVVFTPTPTPTPVATPL